MPETMRARAIIPDEMHVFFLLDHSGSMTGPRIQTLNEAMETLIPTMVSAARSRDVTLFFHALCFNTYVRWLCGSTAEKGVKMDDFQWHEIDAGGMTCTPDAIRAVLPGLSRRILGTRTFCPIVILMTDGESCSFQDTMAAIDEMNQMQKVTRIAIGVQDYNPKELDAFASIGRVIRLDAFGEPIGEPVEQKLMFPVTDAGQIAGVIRAASLSSLVDTLDHLHEDTITVTVPSSEWL